MTMMMKKNMMMLVIKNKEGDGGAEDVYVTD